MVTQLLHSTGTKFDMVVGPFHSLKGLELQTNRQECIHLSLWHSSTFSSYRVGQGRLETGYPPPFRSSIDSVFHTVASTLVPRPSSLAIKCFFF